MFGGFKLGAELEDLAFVFDFFEHFVGGGEGAGLGALIEELRGAREIIIEGQVDLIEQGGFERGGYGRFFVTDPEFQIAADLVEVGPFGRVFGQVKAENGFIEAENAGFDVIG